MDGSTIFGLEGGEMQSRKGIRVAGKAKVNIESMNSRVHRTAGLVGELLVEVEGVWSRVRKGHFLKLEF